MLGASLFTTLNKEDEVTTDTVSLEFGETKRGGGKGKEGNGNLWAKSYRSPDMSKKSKDRLRDPAL